MPIEIVPFICRTDNYGLLFHDPESDVTVSVDTPGEAAIRTRLDERGWRLTHILNTHHHGDHTEGNLGLKSASGATVIGPAAEAAKIPGIDRPVGGGESLSLGGIEVRVIDTPGHTLGHVSYHLPGEGILFSADTLFVMGCGRVFEGTPAMMWDSLRRLAALPPETQVYCGHEYTEANARFALSVEPNNLDLQARADEVRRLRAAGRFTVPTTIAEELRTNPFLRADKPRLRAAVGMADAEPAEVFAELRARKDSFS